MPFLHGIEILEMETGARPVKEARSGVIVLVGTAPVHTVLPENRTVNRLVLSTRDQEDAAHFGAITTGFDLPRSLDLIRAQGAGLVLVVNVFNPAIHTSGEGNDPDPSEVTASDIIGTVDPITGARTGLQLLDEIWPKFGFDPKLILCPQWSTDVAVRAEMLEKAAKFRALALVDMPEGLLPQDVLEERGVGGDYNGSSDRLVICYPRVKVLDKATNAPALAPLAPVLAGIMAARDAKLGYWRSPSNSEIKGIIGTERILTGRLNDPNTDAQLLNERGVVTLFTDPNAGLFTFGNRSSAFPANTSPLNFINVRRTADMIHESVEQAIRPFLDRNITRALVDDVCETVNGFLRDLKRRGAIFGGSCSFDLAKNPKESLEAGHLVFSLAFAPTTPAERITFESVIDRNLINLGVAK